MTEWLHFYFLWSRESAIATGTHYPTNLAQISSDLYPSLHRTFQINASFPGFIINSHLPMQETRVWSLGQEDPLEGGHSNLLQYPCLENPMDRGAWQATVQGVTESDTTEWLHFHVSLMLPLSSELHGCFKGWRDALERVSACHTLLTSLPYHRLRPGAQLLPLPDCGYHLGDSVVFCQPAKCLVTLIFISFHFSIQKFSWRNMMDQISTR